jgi:hypothetical protein
MARRRLGTLGASQIRRSPFSKARHSDEWRVLAGFWREKGGAGRVHSACSACTAGTMFRRERFRALSRGVRALGGSPHYSDATSPPVPSSAPKHGGSGRHPRTRRLVAARRASGGACRTVLLRSALRPALCAPSADRPANRKRRASHPLLPPRFCPKVRVGCADNDRARDARARPNDGSPRFYVFPPMTNPQVPRLSRQEAAAVQSLTAPLVDLTRSPPVGNGRNLARTGPLERCDSTIPGRGRAGPRSWPTKQRTLRFAANVSPSFTSRRIRAGGSIAGFSRESPPRRIPGTRRCASAQRLFFGPSLSSPGSR